MADYPQINDARRLAKRDGLRRCVILFETDAGQVGYSSYGADKALCESTREVMDDYFEDINNDFQCESRRLYSK